MSEEITRRDRIISSIINGDLASVREICATHRFVVCEIEMQYALLCQHYKNETHRELLNYYQRNFEAHLINYNDIIIAMRMRNFQLIHTLLLPDYSGESFYTYDFFTGNNRDRINIFSTYHVDPDVQEFIRINCEIIAKSDSISFSSPEEAIAFLTAHQSQINFIQFHISSEFLRDP
jgi:hypothetical protein